MRESACRAAVLVLLAALATAGSTSAARAQLPDPQVSGRVVRADNGAPIESVTVQLNSGQPNSGCCISRKTDGSGYYHFDRVPDGTYIITAFAKGYLAGDYRIDGPPQDRAQQIDASTRLRDIDFRLVRPATISGTVVDQAGVPPRAGVRVVAIRMTTRPDGSTQYGYAGSSGSTDSAGRFTIPTLKPDTYLVCVNCDLKSDFGAGTGAGAGPQSFGDLGFTWFGNTTSVGAATRVPLAEGENRTGLRIVAGAMKLHSVIVWPAGPEVSSRPPQSYKVHLVPWFAVPWATGDAKKQPDGSYRIDNLPPGHYSLVAYAKWDAYPVAPGLGESVGEGETEFDIAAADVTTRLHVGGLGTVSGVVTWDGHPGAPPKGVDLIASPTGDNLDGKVLGMYTIGPDGRFSVANVLPGAYEFALINNGSGAAIRRARCDGVDVTTATPLRVADRQQVTTCEVALGPASVMGPSTRFAAVSGVPSGMSAVLDARPNDARQVLDLRFTLRSDGPAPLSVDRARCALRETLTNSAGIVTTETEGCPWNKGPMGKDTLLAPGDAVTGDHELFANRFAVATLHVCRAGTWNVQVSFDSPVMPVRFAGIPFEVTRTDCSDSPPLATPGGSRIHWAASTFYGVRLGALVHDVTPGDRIIASMYVDNVSDSTLHLHVGSDAFRVSLRPLGSPFDTSELAPIGARPEALLRTVAVPPHTQMALGDETLSDRYRITPGDYALDIGLLTLSGPAEVANAPTRGPIGDHGNIVHMMLTVTGPVGGGALGVASAAPPGRPSAASLATYQLPAGQSLTRSGRRSVAVSPDGSIIAYIANQQIYVRRPSELNARALQGTREDPADLTFSPDGQWVAYFVPSTAGQAYTLKKVALSGGRPITLATTPRPWGASWAGDQIVFASNGTAGHDIESVSASGGEPRTLLSVSRAEEVASPQLVGDGRVVFTYRATRAVAWDDADIVVQRVDGGSRTVLAHGGSDGHLLATGDLVYFSDGALLAVSVDTSRWERRGEPVRLVEGVRGSDRDLAGIAQYAVSDGGTLVYAGPATPAASQGGPIPPERLTIITKWLDDVRRLVKPRA